MNVFWRYWLLQIPGWIVLTGLLAAARHFLGLSTGWAVAVMALWLVKDAALYPILKPHYVFRHRDVHDSLVGSRAIAEQTLCPRGYVRLRGELWMAELDLSHGEAAAGESVVVESVDGLTLKVSR